jgi:hypothetical protein
MTNVTLQIASPPCARSLAIDSSRVFRKNVAVEMQMFVPAFESDCLAQLLHRQSGSWMGGDAAMDEAAAAMFSHHKHV